MSIKLRAIGVPDAGTYTLICPYCEQRQARWVENPDPGIVVACDCCDRRFVASLMIVTVSERIESEMSPHEKLTLDVDVNGEPVNDEPDDDESPLGIHDGLEPYGHDTPLGVEFDDDPIPF